MARLKKPPLNRCPDFSRLKRMLKDRKLSQRKAGELLGVAGNTVRAYIEGEAFPSLPVFRALCLGLGLDLFEVCELLRLPYLHHLDLVCFRAACRRNHTTPLQAIKDFITLYAVLVPEEER